MDTALYNAQQRLAALHQKRKELTASIDAEIADVEGFIRQYKKFAGPQVDIQFTEPRPYVGANIGNTPNQAISFTVSAPSSKGEHIVATAQAILMDGKPRLTRLLLEEIQACGVPVGGTDPAANLSVYLSRAGMFQSDRKFGWSLKKVEPETAPTVTGSDTTQPAP